MSRRRQKPNHPDGTAAIAEFAVTTSLTGRAFLEEYRRLRFAGGAGNAPHHPKAIAITVKILRKTAAWDQRELRRLLGGTQAQARLVQPAICEALGIRCRIHPLRCRDEDQARTEFGDWALSEFGALPNTYLAPDAGAGMTAPRPQYGVRVLALVHPLVRLNAGLSMILSAARHEDVKRPTDYLNAWESFDAWATRTGASLAPRRYLPEAMLAWLADDPSPRRLAYWQLLAKCAMRIHLYFEDYPECRGSVEGRILHIPQTRSYLAARQIAACVVEGAAARRAQTANPIADRFSDVLRLLDQRYDAVTTIRQAFDQTCDQLASAPRTIKKMEFSVTLPAATLQGDVLGGVITVRFAVYRASKLRARFMPEHDRSVASDGFFLVLSAIESPLDSARFPLLEAYQYGVFMPITERRDRDAPAYDRFVREVAENMATAHFDPFRFADNNDRRLAERAFRKGMVLVPIGEIHRALAIARALGRCGMLAGARISETTQQYHDPECFGIADRANDQFYFLARPKMKISLQRFYIDSHTLDAITEVVALARYNGDPIVPIRHRLAGLAKRKYIYQMRGRQLTLNELNAILQVALYGFAVRSHDLRAAFGRYSKHVGCEPRAIQATLHHSSPVSTSIYTVSTQAMKRELALKLSRQVRGRQVK